MNKVLRLNVAGTPIAWVTEQDAATLYIKNQVLWELGTPYSKMRGGINRQGKQSQVALCPVIATQGNVRPIDCTDNISNRMLFRRDNDMCMYCGMRFRHSELTRDHIFPRSRGGKDTWQNLVAACKRCNNVKADRTPEEAGMALLAVPFRPNIYEVMYLSQHVVLKDQMAYLQQQFSRNRNWTSEEIAS